MVANLQTYVAYRCPDCGTLIYGFVGKFALSANLLRIKCRCGKYAMDITMTNDGKVRLSVPCVFCKESHNFVVSQSIFFGRDLFLLNCPYANMDICFIGSEDKVEEATDRATEELENLLSDLAADSLSDIQPTDLDEEEILPDPAVYDTVRFLVKDLEADGAIDCPCHRGEYDLRFCDEGIEVYCPDCGASKIFHTTGSEDYLTIRSLTLE